MWKAGFLKMLLAISWSAMQGSDSSFETSIVIEKHYMATHQLRAFHTISANDIYKKQHQKTFR